jgi:hypothetical protein
MFNPVYFLHMHWGYPSKTSMEPVLVHKCNDMLCNIMHLWSSTRHVKLWQDGHHITLVFITDASDVMLAKVFGNLPGFVEADVIDLMPSSPSFEQRRY